jgi:hypothetical protein
MQPYPSNGIAVGVVAGAVPDLRATVSLAVVHGTSVPQSSLVRFCLPSAQEHVVLTLNDLQGRVVRRLVDGAVSGGMHVVSMGERSGAVPAGMYLLRFRGGNVDRCMAIALTR